MRKLSWVALIALAFTCSAWGQRGTSTDNSLHLQINGQVRLDDRPAPQGVLVLLDMAPNRDVAAAGSGELGRAVTDSSGKFLFDGFQNARGGTKLFAVTVHYPGYRDAVQIVDLAFSQRGYVNLVMRRDTSKDAVNVPPKGSGDFISAKQPATPGAQEALGRGEQLLLEKHDPKASIEEFKKVTKLDPDYGPAYLLLGTAYMQTQEWTDAKSAFEKATKLDPTNADAFTGIGAALNQQQDYSGAQKPLQHSLELKPDSAEANYELGRSLWALGKWQDAEPHVRKAIDLNKDFAGPHILMGNIYLRRRDANSALAEFKESLRLDPQGPFSDPVKEMIAKIEKALPH